jgi:large subunit ribosomal protein L17
MRHGKKFNHLSRKSPHRKAMLANMASSLIVHKRIKTTVAKAKALKVYVEPLITRSKDDSTHSRRVVFSYLQDKEAVTELFREVSQRVLNRPGGYTRILKTGNRLGDNAEMCIIELVDYNENLLKDFTQKPKSKRRRRGGKKSAAAETDVAVVEAPEVADETVEETEAVTEETTEDVVEETPEAKEEAASDEDTADEPVAEKADEAPSAETTETKEDEPEAKEEPKNEESDSAEVSSDKKE